MDLDNRIDWKISVRKFLFKVKIKDRRLNENSILYIEQHFSENQRRICLRDMNDYPLQMRFYSENSTFQNLLLRTKTFVKNYFRDTRHISGNFLGKLLE